MMDHAAAASVFRKAVLCERMFERFSSLPTKTACNGPAFAVVEKGPDCCQMGMHTVQCKFHLRNHGVAQNRDE
ncbi:hypothetical protein RBSWK_01053 [Rhodopirellula baltica SWK14]|uniref:Uncharacterized protein n=1 Tax=Rhodopirellula baltica SWK14 TaxID=993516 RepID=L7CM68_RHOBT|nr:hypothetical protein RBSWK_01053 [Rhodopirellula baltica SWK14]